MHLQKDLGRQLCFDNGLSIGFSWVHCNGETTKRSAILAAYHPSRSITWLWCIYWERPAKIFCAPTWWRWRPSDSAGNSTVTLTLTLPIVGSLSLRRQQAMWRA